MRNANVGAVGGLVVSAAHFGGVEFSFLGFC
jgi:hypothetical protein